MHKINVLTFGSENFSTSLHELKEYLSFKLIICDDNFDNKTFDNFDVLLIHEQFLKDHSDKHHLLDESKKVKILAFHLKNSSSDIYTEKLSLPTTIKDINQIVENSIIKKNFSKNSSIKIKDYILNKNEKTLLKHNKFILLTEKEIQLLELFQKNSKPITKKKILEEVWQYAPEADTHTVETHIYRLRKKIKTKFLDEYFIINNKNGYLL